VRAPLEFNFNNARISHKNVKVIVAKISFTQLSYSIAAVKLAVLVTKWRADVKWHNIFYCDILTGNNDVRHNTKSYHIRFSNYYFFFWIVLLSHQIA